MNKNILSAFFALLVFCFNAAAQPSPAVSQTTLIRIVRAEDERRFDRDLQELLKSSIAAVRARAALAAGRIGNDAAVSFLIQLLDKETNGDARQTAVFALGEIESIKAADIVLKILQNERETEQARARAVEAAGKIAAANSKNEQSKSLGEAVLDALETEHAKANRSREIVLFGLTAVLRARPSEADVVLAQFLTDKDASIRADALNTLARLRAKNENTNAKMRALLLSDASPVVRANAARALGAAEDKQALNLLTEAAVNDEDSRVRVSAIRSLAALKDQTAAAPLLTRGEKLLADYKKAKTKFPTPTEKNELLEIASTLGRLLQNSKNEYAVKLLKDFSKMENHGSSETEIALFRITPDEYVNEKSRLETIEKFCGDAVPLIQTLKFDWRAINSVSQALAETANLDKKQNERIWRNSSYEIAQFLLVPLNIRFREELDSETLNLAMRIAPAALQAYAAFKTDNLSEVLLKHLKHKDIIVRATAAEILSNQVESKENVEALKTAFAQSLTTDKYENDAQLAILSALVKLNKNEAVSSLKLALDAPDYLVRRHAAQLVRENDLTREFPNLEAKVGIVKPYNPASGTKLGQIFYTEADYARAVSRKNGQARAVLTTEKGVFEIEFFPEDAPLAVDNFIRLAKSNYFNGIAVHRVVPNFVMQDGDPRGDGNGSPGWQIRCEINEIPYERGAVGMALSGKDTGGSQWFVTHSPQPHLDGGYTVFGRVNEAGMKIVDNIARGDRILSVKIIEGNVSRKAAKSQRKTK